MKDFDVELIGLAFNLGLPLLLVLAGYVLGRLLEQRHYASIRTRERALQNVIALNTRYVPEGVPAAGGELVSGSVVISSDYFKTFVAGFRNLIGGRFRGYETLMERGRREALLRMKQQARDAGCSLVIGVRFHTTRVAGRKTPSMEVMAYGTAVRTGSAAAGPPPRPALAAPWTPDHTAPAPHSANGPAAPSR